MLIILCLPYVRGQGGDPIAKAAAHAERDVLADAKAIMGLGWRDLADHRAEFDSVISYMQDYDDAPSLRGPTIAELVEMASGEGMLTQAVMVGMGRTSSFSIEDAMKFFDKLAAASEDRDIPRRGWFGRWAMLYRTASMITMLEHGRSTTDAENRLAIRDPFLWKQLFESDRLDEVEALVASGAPQQPVEASGSEGPPEAAQAVNRALSVAAAFIGVGCHGQLDRDVQIVRDLADVELTEKLRTSPNLFAMQIVSDPRNGLHGKRAPATRVEEDGAVRYEIDFAAAHSRSERNVIKGQYVIVYSRIGSYADKGEYDFTNESHDSTERMRGTVAKTYTAFQSGGTVLSATTPDEAVNYIELSWMEIPDHWPSLLAPLLKATGEGGELRDWQEERRLALFEASISDNQFLSAVSIPRLLERPDLDSKTVTIVYESQAGIVRSVAVQAILSSRYGASMANRVLSDFEREIEKESGYYLL